MAGRTRSAVAVLVLLGVLVGAGGADATTRIERKRIARVIQIYNDLLGTGPEAIIGGTKSAGDIFDGTVRGRVTPLGQYNDFEGAREYFYGLLVAPTVSAPEVRIRAPAATGDQVAVKADVTIDLSGTPLRRVVTLRETGFFTFNAKNKVTSFDLAILNPGAALDPRSDAEKQERLRSVCLLAATDCPGEWDRATTPEKASDCASFMAGKPYGSWNRGNSDTFTCRELHSVLTLLRPEVHCPHVGKTGGGVCVDVPYEWFFDVQY